MHEAAITAALLEQVRGIVPDGSRLLWCRVEVGDLEHLDETVLATLWRAMIEGTPLRGASLEIERIPLQVRCGACGLAYEPQDKAVLLCPACGSVRPEILEGVGVVLRSLEVEEAASAAGEE